MLVTSRADELLSIPKGLRGLAAHPKKVLVSPAADLKDFVEKLVHRLQLVLGVSIRVKV